MTDLAFNWAGVAYDTGKPIRIQEQVIRIVNDTTVVKFESDISSLMLEQPIFSPEDIQVQGAKE